MHSRDDFYSISNAEFGDCAKRSLTDYQLADLRTAEGTMFDALSFIFEHRGYIPHGHCYLWQPALLWLHILSDTLIAIAYYSIPFMLIYFVQQRKDVPFDWIFLLFGAFIIACGTTHLMDVWTLWHPTYWLSGGLKAATALISCYTAISLIPLLPKALALSSPAQLATINQELEREIVDRQQTEALLQENQRFIEKITSTSPVILYVYDLVKRRNIYINQEVSTLLGHTPREVQLMGTEVLKTLVHPEDLPAVQGRFDRWTAIEAEVVSTEIRMRRVDGEWRDFLLQETLFATDVDGVPTQILGAAQDITDRKRVELQLQASLREKDVLLQEVHHRVKNNLQIIYSLLRLQYRRVRDPAAAAILRESQNRVKSIALIHEKLYRSPDLSKVQLRDYISNLTSHLLSSYKTDTCTVALRTQIDDITLSLDTAIPCGLIVNELVSNCLKYAFADRANGEIYIQLRREKAGSLELTVKDNGIGLPTGFSVSEINSLGLRLVKDLANQINGVLEITSDTGTEFKLAFPTNTHDA